MDDVSRMHVLQTSEDLINEKLNMAVAKRLWALYDRSQISVHQFRDDIDVIECLSRFRQHHGFVAHDLCKP
jgi:hypothetical protein